MPNANLDTSTSVPPTLTIRQAAISDLDVLEQVENTCFLGDKLSRRRLKHWLQANNRIF